MARKTTRHLQLITLILESVIRAQHQPPQNKRTTKNTNQTKLRIDQRLVLLNHVILNSQRTLKTQNKHFKGSCLVASKTVYRLSVNKASNLFHKLHLTTHTFRNYHTIIPYQNIGQGALHRLVTNSTPAVVNRQKTKMSQTKSWLPNR